MRILLIEDTAALGEAIREQIADDGHAVDWVTLLKQAQGCVQTTPYDLTLLDLLLPDGKGIDFLQQLREGGNSTPVIILTALDQISDRIAGLNAGADDYLVKPFDLDELSARASAVVRRYHGNPSPVLNLCGLAIDLIGHTVHKDGQALDLSAREWAVFEALIQRPGALLSKAQLEDRLYEFGAEIESNTIEVYVSRLRKRLGREVIETVRGMGYRLAHS